jgi:hypothetical protein
VPSTAFSVFLIFNFKKDIQLVKKNARAVTVTKRNKVGECFMLYSQWPEDELITSEKLRLVNRTSRNVVNENCYSIKIQSP